MGRWARKPVNHTSWVALVTPTDRPKSVRNRCLIELFCGVVCVVTLPFWHFCWCRGFCHRTESDLFLFLLSKYAKYGKYCIRLLQAMKSHIERIYRTETGPIWKMKIPAFLRAVINNTRGLLDHFKEKYGKRKIRVFKIWNFCFFTCLFFCS